MDVRQFDFDLPAELIAQEPAPDRAAARLLTLDRQSGAIGHASIASLPELLRPGDLVVVNDTRVFPARLLGRRVPSGGAVECLLVSRRSDRASDSVSGPVSEAVSGPVSDSVSGPVSDSVSGPVSGSVSGPVSGSVSGRVSETVSGPVSETPSDRSAVWEALMHPGQKLKPGSRVIFDGAVTIHGEVLERLYFGRRSIRLWTDDGSGLDAAVDAVGHVPLPPYIKRADENADRDRYQTVFARTRGSVAAPTAGLHFTPALLDALRGRGIERAEITLHVGYGTFQPVRVDRVEDHRLEAERYFIPEQSADAIEQARRDGRRVVAVGTTTTRTLEAVARANGGRVVAGAGTTDLFIYPGFSFGVIGGLLTNFHLPQSSLLMLVAAFAGVDRVRTAYDAAIEERYRFYSYGDAMLITNS